MANSNLYRKYINNLNDDYKIAKLRNTLLNNKHEKIPSYCFWSSDDISNETIQERKHWLERFYDESKSSLSH